MRLWGAVVAGLLAASFLAAGCGSPSDEVVIYSGRREQFVVPLIEEFERETGIRVRLLSGDAVQYAHRIVEERGRPQADLLLANDAGVMEYLRLRDVLDGYSSAAVELIPSPFRAPDGSWIGLSARSRVIMYNPDLISEGELPGSVLDLADPRYRGRLAITRAGNASMVSHVGALRAALGDDVTEDFLRRLVDNEPVVMSGHTDIRKAVGAGEVALGLVNNYYFHLQLREDKGNNVLAIYPDQGEGEMGTFVNVAGAALIRGGPNPDAARAFMEFLLRPGSQEVFAGLSMETPLVPGVPAPEGSVPVDGYRHLGIDLWQLGPMWEDTTALMERAGYGD